MGLREAVEIFIKRGYIEVEGGKYFDGDKWRLACYVLSKFLEDNPGIWETESEVR